jgi:hypothetical protein
LASIILLLKDQRTALHGALSSGPGACGRAVPRGPAGPHVRAGFDSLWAALRHSVSLAAVLIPPCWISWRSILISFTPRDTKGDRLAGALATREEAEALRGNLSTEAESKYNEVLR